MRAGKRKDQNQSFVLPGGSWLRLAVDTELDRRWWCQVLGSIMRSPNCSVLTVEKPELQPPVPVIASNCQR